MHIYPVEAKSKAPNDKHVIGEDRIFIFIWGGGGGGLPEWYCKG